MIRGSGHITPGCDGTSTMSPGLIRNQPVGLGFHTLRGGINPGDDCFHPPWCSGRRCMEGCLIRGRNIIVLGCGGTSTSSRETILHARWLQEPQLTSNQPVRLGFIYLAGRDRPGDIRFRSRVVRLYFYGRIADAGVEQYYPGVRRDLDVVPNGNSSSRASFMSPT